MVVSALILGATVYLFMIIPKGFLPTQDTGQIIIFTQTAQGISYDAMESHTLVLMKILKDDPNIDSFFAGIGGGGPMGGLNNGIMFVHLKDHRKLNADAGSSMNCVPRYRKYRGCWCSCKTRRRSS